MPDIEHAGRFTLTYAKVLMHCPNDDRRLVWPSPLPLIIPCEVYFVSESGSFDD
jgi:hypothetical protein